MATRSRKGTVREVLSQFHKLTEKPDVFLRQHTKEATAIRQATKQLYDFTKSKEDNTSSDALPELILDKFDDEQVWQEIELQNNACFNSLLSSVARVVAARDTCTLCIETCQKERETNSSRQHQPGPDQQIDHQISAGMEEDEMEEDSETDMFIKQSRTTLDKIQDSDSDLDFDFGDIATDPKAQQSAGSENETESSDSDVSEDNPMGKKSRKHKGKGDGSAKRKTVVDDKFFKLADMEAFLEQEDAREERARLREHRQATGQSDDDEESDQDDDIDVFTDLPSDNDEENNSQQSSGRELRYEDFFDPPDEEEPSKKKVKFLDEMEEQWESGSKGERTVDNPALLTSSDSEGDDMADALGREREEESGFEKRQSRLKQKIAALEDKSIAEKPWQLAGEITASSRPQNSLLQEDLDFEHTTKQAPVVTEETTQKLEDIIKQRIQDQAWDDVERKEKPKEEPFEYKKRLVLDQEKSKMSLAEVYEQEYIKQTQKKEEVEEADPEHEEIRKMMSSLFTKLDALSNYHYTPTAAAPEVKIVSNLPAISMEEVAPVTVSDSALLAPAEIHEKQKGDLKGSTEKSGTDRKRERRQKKARKRMRLKEKEHKQKLMEQMNPGLGNKYARERAVASLQKQSKSGTAVTIIQDDRKDKKGLKSSKDFFSKLQEEVTTHVQSRKAEKRKKNRDKAKSSTKLKL